MAGADVVLALGDLAAEFVRGARFAAAHHHQDLLPTTPRLRLRLVPAARADRVVVAPGSGAAVVHAARVRFAEGSPEHEVAVGCCASRPGGGGEDDDQLWVSVDGRTAVHARRLRWNFRGSQTVFVDGAPVDVLWDLHGWCFRDPPGCAIVMLRARTALESRLWLEDEEEEEKAAAAAAAAPGFAFLVQAFKAPPP